MGRCRHRVVYASFWLSGEWVVLLGDEPRADKRRCTKCGTWLPLGPANDGDEHVRVEIRAAELATIKRWFDKREYEAESYGALQFHNGGTPGCNDDGGWDNNATSEWVGYLARQIATHPNREEGDL